MTYSRETWKLLLTKTSAVLDDALIMVAHVVSNMVMGSFCDEINIVKQFNCFHLFSKILWIFLQIKLYLTSHYPLTQSLTVMGPSVTPVLDVLGELRLDLISDMLWKDISFISALFGDGLRPFLSSASGSLLQCVSGKNLTCQTFQHMYVKYWHTWYNMIWYITVWDSMAWYFVIHLGYSLILCTSISYDIMYGMIWYCTIQYYTFQCSTLIRYKIILHLHLHIADAFIQSYEQ